MNETTKAYLKELKEFAQQRQKYLKRIKMTKSIKQKWVFERCYLNKGSLTGIEVRLRQIANGPSTLSPETGTLIKISDILKEILAGWDNKMRKDASWKRFSERRNKNEPR